MKVFIDGQAGTTGLQLEQRLQARSDIELLTLDSNTRKDTAARLAMMRRADCIFLCLPDDEARTAAAAAPADTLLIDASTAHRTVPGWVYGLPELSSRHRESIARSKRIAVPGCHAAGLITLISPLIMSGLLPKESRLSCTSLTGYSGGGKNLIETYESGRRPGDPLHAPRPYALGLTHKHLPEMKAVIGLEQPPHFLPVVGDMARGMLVTVPLWGYNINKVWDTLARHYENSRFINVLPPDNAIHTHNGFLDPTACNGTNRMDVFVFGHNTQILLAARFDNLGKGASGAAVQCMNIACGMAEDMGLSI
jgi:N-acetyl-gamma-glutamyl-phosphate reductase